MRTKTRLTPAQRTLRAKLAANSRWSREDGHANAVRGQAGLLAKFEREVDPDGTLTPEQRAKRAEAAYRAHMQRLAFASSKARAARKGGDTDAGAA